jgi:hypothetical protein
MVAITASQVVPPCHWEDDELDDDDDDFTVG